MLEAQQTSDGSFRRRAAPPLMTLGRPVLVTATLVCLASSVERPDGVSATRVIVILSGRHQHGLVLLVRSADLSLLPPPPLLGLACLCL